MHNIGPYGNQHGELFNFENGDTCYRSHGQQCQNPLKQDYIHVSLEATDVTMKIDSPKFALPLTEPKTNETVHEDN